MSRLLPHSWKSLARRSQGGRITWERILRRASGTKLACLALALVQLSWPLEATIIARDPGGLTAETAALILSGQQGGDLAMEAIAVPIAWGEGAATVGLFVEVAGRDLVSGQEEEVLRVEFLVYAIEGETSVRGYVMQAFELDLGRYGEVLAGGGLKFSGQLDLPPGDYSLAFMVRSPKPDASGLALRRVAVSVPAAGSPSLLQPRFPEVEDAWIHVSQVLTATKEGGVSRARLNQASRRSSAKPVLANGTSIDVLIAESAPTPTGELWFEFLDERGQVVGEVVSFEPSEASELSEPAQPAELSEPAQLLEPAPDDSVIDPPPPSIRSFELVGLEPGDYLMRARLSGATDEPIYSPAQQVLIVADADNLGSWAAASEQEVMIAAPAGTADNAAIPTRTRKAKVRSQDVELLKRRYRTVLSESADRNRSGAAEALRQIEFDAVAEFGDRGVPSLVVAEMGLIKTLGKESPEALVPVARLHHEVYREHRSRRAFLLATHARNLALAVVELYIEGGTREESERLLALRSKDERLKVAARILASFGGDLQRAGLRRFSERLFQRALECDDSNEAALLGLGASFEKYSEYAGAANYFERLVAVQPQHGEGRLRLAINQRRLGRKSKARQQLERIAEGSYERWVQLLAFQELAQMHFEAGDLQQAEGLLDQALLRFPEEQKFYLQLAYLRNAVGEPWRAQAELNRLSNSRSGAGDSPRYRYSDWPSAALDRAWAQTDEDVGSRLEALAAAVPANSKSVGP